MDTALSTKRMYVKPGVAGSSSKESSFAGVALPGGVLLMVAGAVANFDPAVIAGFFFSACSFLYLNAKFWGKWFDEHPDDAARQVEDALRSRMD